MTQLPVQLLQLLGLGLGHTGPSGSDSDFETNAHSPTPPALGIQAHLQGVFGSLQSPAHQGETALHLHALPLLGGQVLAQAFSHRRCG